MSICKKTALKLAAALFLVLLFMKPMPVFAEDEDIDIVVNGKAVTFEDVGPRYAKRRVMVPVGRFCAALGARVVWDAASQDIFIYLYDRYVWLQSTNMTLYYGNFAVAADGSGEIYLTSVTPVPLEVRPDLAKGRLVAPLGALTAALGGTVSWDADTETAFITGSAYAPTRYYEDVRDSAAEAFGANGAPLYTSPGYYQLLTVEDVLTKYEADDPMLLICYNSTHTVARREMLRAAADRETKAYGLDTTGLDNQNALPFISQQDVNGNAMTVYVISGYGQVKALAVPDYAAALNAINEYWVAD